MRSKSDASQLTTKQELILNLGDFILHEWPLREVLVSITYIVLDASVRRDSPGWGKRGRGTLGASISGHLALRVPAKSPSRNSSQSSSHLSPYDTMGKRGGRNVRIPIISVALQSNNYVVQRSWKGRIRRRWISRTRHKLHRDTKAE